MKKNAELASAAFGLREYILSALVSMPIWLEMKDNVFTPSIVFFVFLLVTVLVTIWQTVKRKKAVVYLIALAVRMAYLSSTFVICQVGGLFDNDSLKYFWLIITMTILLIGSTFHFNFEKKNWGATLKDWEKINKLNIEKQYFKISGAFHSRPPAPEDFKKIYTIIPLGTIALTIIVGILGNDFKTAFLHFILLALGYFYSYAFSRSLAWVGEIKKLETELGVTFVTEYGMTETKSKRRKR